MAPTTGSIDITDLVSSMQSTFVTWATNLAFGALIVVPGLSWIGWPVISSIVRSGISFVVGTLANDAVLAAFFFNTAIKKASQAADYSTAVNAKLNLPPTATEAEYAQAEQNEIQAFHNFVLLSS